MDSKKQKFLIELLISSSDTFALCQNIIDSTYFDPEFRNSVGFIKQYYEDYSTTPNIHQIEAETNQKFEIREIKPDEIKYCANEIEKFCKHSAMKKVSLAMPGLIKEGKYAEAAEIAKAAVLVSLTKNLGVRYFQTVEERLKRMIKEDPTFPTGWTDIDDALFGGISRKELLLVSGNTGGGKSITLANLAFNFINAGMNVLYISLELSADIVAQRFDTMFTGISRRNWKEYTDEISTRITAFGEEAGILDIIKMPSGTTSNQIRAYLKEFYLHYNMTPDLLIVDYLDKMSPNEYVSADNVFEKDKRSSEQLREICVDHNMFGATASQLNRCLYINTVVNEKDKGDIKLKNVEIGNYLKTLNGYNKVINKTEPIKQKTYKIKTKSGKEVICSGRHVWPTANNIEKSIETGLRVGDLLIIWEYDFKNNRKEVIKKCKQFLMK